MQSMTGFGTAQAQGEPGSVTIEIRSVNSRYLDLSFRIPEELRHAEMPLRELISQSIKRGKIEVRASYVRSTVQTESLISDQLLHVVEQTYQRARKIVGDLQPPTLSDILQWPEANRSISDPAQWLSLCQQAGRLAIDQLLESREREGQRLSVIIADIASQIDQKVQTLEGRLPALMQLQQDRLAARMREVLEQVAPQTTLSGPELSERITAEASLFSLRADVAEEIGRLRSHLIELISILEEKPARAQQAKGHGKKLDFLFQEMNREANTLGSKAVHMDMTRTSIDLKLLIEQMREQIQNIE